PWSQSFELAASASIPMAFVKAGRVRFRPSRTGVLCSSWSLKSVTAEASPTVLRVALRSAMAAIKVGKNFCTRPFLRDKFPDLEARARLTVIGTPIRSGAKNADNVLGFYCRSKGIELLL